MLEAFLVSTAVVALGEIGDKTQLLALLLAARFRQPRPIILGILVATLANHAGASLLGAWLARVVDPQWMRWVLGGSFLAVAAWMLVPDKADGLDSGNTSRFGVFGVTTVAFFLAEMGDKTQIATVMLAAQYPHFVMVVIGTTLGMLIANVPVVLAGNFAADRLPLTLIRRLAALAFAVLAVYAACQALGLTGTL